MGPLIASFVRFGIALLGVVLLIDAGMSLWANDKPEAFMSCFLAAVLSISLQLNTIQRQLAEQTQLMRED